MCHKTFRYFKVFLTVLVLLTITTIVLADEYLFPNLAGDANSIDFEDFAALAENWQKTGSSLAGDFDDSGTVDFNDLKILCDYWLAGTQPPEDVFELFKTALAAGDVNEAVSHFADFVADDYRVIFNENISKLHDMVNDMGNLSIEYRDKDIAVYEISNGTGTNFYPIVFTLDDDYKWKITVF